MSKENTDLEIQLMHESDYHIQNEYALRKLVEEIQPFLKELLKFSLDPDLYDWGEFVLKDIAKIKRQCTFRKTMYLRRYPNG